MEQYHEEEILGKAYDARLMKRLLSYLKPYRTEFALSFGLLICVSLLQLAGPYLTKIAIDSYIRTGNLAGLDVIGLIYIIVLGLIFLLQYAQTYTMELMGQKVMYDLRIEIFSHLQKMSLSYFDKNPVGRLMTRVVNDIEVLNEMFSSGLVTIFGDLFVLAGISAAMLALSWKLALIIFTVIPPIILATAIYRQKARAIYRLMRTQLAKLNAFLQENISGMGTVQAFGRESKNFQQFDDLNRTNLNYMLKAIFYNALFFPVVEIISAIAIGLIIWYGGGQVIQNLIMPGVIVAFIQYTNRFFMPIRDLAEKYNILQAAMASSERTFKVLDTKEEVVSPVKPVKLGPVRGEIEYKDVWFAYKPGEDVLRGFSLRIEPGERLALVGQTGAGKTTAVSLLLRFYEFQKGQILLDGVDIRRLDKYELRKKIGLVLQDTFIFSGTVRDNISLGSAEIPLQKAVDAARIVNAHRFIEKLPGQYDSAIEERGSTLSFGQRQLLAFARALAFDPPILIFDEATSSVDPDTEMAIREAIDELLKGRTSIIIAHRLSTIQKATRIAVVHKGRIVETGTHEELMRRKRFYYKLYRIQWEGQVAFKGA